MSSWSGLYGRLDKKIVKSEPRTQSISAATQWARDKLDIRLDKYKVARPQVDLGKVQGVAKITHHPAPFSQEKLEKLCSAAGSTGTTEVAEVAPDNVKAPAAEPTPGRAGKAGRPKMTEEQKAAKAAARAARTPEEMAAAAEASAAKQAARAAKIREAAARAAPANIGGGGGGGGGGTQNSGDSSSGEDQHKGRPRFNQTPRMRVLAAKAAERLAEAAGNGAKGDNKKKK